MPYWAALQLEIASIGEASALKIDFFKNKLRGQNREVSPAKRCDESGLL